jgi:hypothetical protein
VPTLRELQATFAAGLRGMPQDVGDWAADDRIAAAARLGVYRNNAQASFEQALEQTYPVVRRRVGDDYFRQLAHHYRRAQPSRTGDLHEVGRYFAGFLAAQLAHGPYAWLAELAQLEWAVADAAVAADSATVGAAALAGFAPEVLEHARLQFVRSLRLIAATVPVLSVWQANQPGVPACSTDLSTGAQYVIVHRAADGLQLRAVGPRAFALVAALGGGSTLSHAVDASDMPLDELPPLLHLLFADATVAAVRAAATPG